MVLPHAGCAWTRLAEPGAAHAKQHARNRPRIVAVPPGGEFFLHLSPKVQHRSARADRERYGKWHGGQFTHGEASFTTRGTIKDGHPEPTNFTSKTVSNSETFDVTMVLDEGSVKELVGASPSLDRVPVTAANRRGIVDPLTAVLFSSGGAGEMLSQETCRRTLPIFDGHQRYDLKLAFKRMDKVTAEKGYAGPIVVCSVNYEPIAGHRANIPLVKYLSEGREMEIALAPIAGTRLLAPFRLSVVSTLANLVIEANRFETIMTPAPEGTPPNIARPSEISPPSRDGVVQRCERASSGLVLCQEVPKPAPERR
jgi:hypothetical protein